MPDGLCNVCVCYWLNAEFTRRLLDCISCLLCIAGECDLKPRVVVGMQAGQAEFWDTLSPAEDDGLLFEWFAKQARGKLGNAGLASLVADECRAGGDATKRFCAASFPNPLLEASKKHPHFDALRAAILVCLVNDQKRPPLGVSIVEQRAVVWAQKEILQHGIVREQNVRRFSPHFRA